MANAMKTISKIGTVPEFEPQAVVRLMQRLNVNERGLAFLMNVTPTTVKLWTVGAAEPCNPAKRLMQLLGEVPGLVEQFVEENE